MDTFLLVLSITLSVIGAGVSFLAKVIVKKMNLSERQSIKGIEDSKSLGSLKQQKAIMKVKLIGAGIFLPGMIMLYILLKSM